MAKPVLDVVVPCFQSGAKRALLYKSTMADTDSSEVVSDVTETKEQGRLGGAGMRGRGGGGGRKYP